MRRRAALLLAALALATGVACGGGGGDDDVAAEDDETTTTTAKGEDLAALNDEGADVFGDYITALLGGNYQVAMDNATGAASAVAGYFNTLTQIKSVPAEFKPPNRQVKLSFAGDKATRNSDGTITLSGRVEADITGGGADEQTTYSDIKLREEEGKLQVVDFVRGEDGPVSEDVYRTEGAKGSGNGIDVTMGPGFGMRGKIGAGGRTFTNFVFAFTNNTDYELSVRETTNNRLNFGALLVTEGKRHHSDSTYGTAAAPGARGFGFAYFNATVTEPAGILSIDFEDQDGDKYEVKVPLDTL
jgi:hypothetical protein